MSIDSQYQFLSDFDHFLIALLLINKVNVQLKCFTKSLHFHLIQSSNNKYLIYKAESQLKIIMSSTQLLQVSGFYGSQINFFVLFSFCTKFHRHSISFSLRVRVPQKPKQIAICWAEKVMSTLMSKFLGQKRHSWANLEHSWAIYLDGWFYYYI